MTEHSFSKACRLLSPNDFKPVFDQPDFRLGTPPLLLLVKRNQLGWSRLGLVVAKRQIKLANRRNRTKRLIRESFRQQNFVFSVDIVVLVRQPADLMDNKQLFDLLSKQWLRLQQKSQNLFIQ